MNKLIIHSFMFLFTSPPQWHNGARLSEVECDRGIVFSVSRHQLASSSVVALRGCGHQGVKHQGFILGCEASVEAERIVEAPSKSASLHNAFMLLHSLIQIWTTQNHQQQLILNQHRDSEQTWPWRSDWWLMHNKHEFHTPFFFKHMRSDSIQVGMLPSGSSYSLLSTRLVR